MHSIPSNMAHGFSCARDCIAYLKCKFTRLTCASPGTFTLFLMHWWLPYLGKAHVFSFSCVFQRVLCIGTSRAAVPLACAVPS